MRGAACRRIVDGYGRAGLPMSMADDPERQPRPAEPHRRRPEEKTADADEVMTATSTSTGSRPVTMVPPGSLLVMFGGAAELVAVDHEPCPGFPHARRLTIRPVAGGEEMSVLVPSDFAPLVLPR